MLALRRDAAFLARHSLLDYSLLVGVHELASPRAEKRGAAEAEVAEVAEVEAARTAARYPPERTPGLVAVSDAGMVCYVAIVDILTEYTLAKAAETFFTGTICGCRDVSCQPPERCGLASLDLPPNVAHPCTHARRKFRSPSHPPCPIRMRPPSLSRPQVCGALPRLPHEHCVHAGALVAPGRASVSEIFRL